MNDNATIYELVYALAARDGREKALFGPCAPLAREAFARSVPTSDFPELWFELPLAGEPWFDLDALTAHESLEPDMVFSPETTGSHPNAFAWFAAEGDDVRQLALSWDVSSGDIEYPAVQLLIRRYAPDTACDFLAAAGRPDTIPAYRAFVERIPEGWFACYAGVFPQRPGHNLRVECIPTQDLQLAYAADANLLKAHLRQTGLDELGDTIVPRCHLLAGTPFQLEFQFDVESDGAAGSTFGASVRFAKPPGNSSFQSFGSQDATESLMKKLESWGLADSRWHLLADTIFAKRVARGNESTVLYCYPAFVKLRWREGEPLDAKTYLIAGAQ